MIEIRAIVTQGKGWGGVNCKKTQRSSMGDLEIEEIYKSWWDLVHIRSMGRQWPCQAQKAGNPKFLTDHHQLCHQQGDIKAE